MTTDLIPIEAIQHRILVLRGSKVLLDNDLAVLYGVSTKRLNEQVKRNAGRFPDDFMFQLTKEEKNELVANCDRFNPLKHSTSLPFAFTEHGALMAANVLRSEQAVRMSVRAVCLWFVHFVVAYRIVFTDAPTHIPHSVSSVAKPPALPAVGCGLKFLY